MGTPTVFERVKQILDHAQGNQAKAELLMRQLIDRDPQFLRQLVEPHLRGIIAHALSRAPTQQPKAATKPSLSDDGMSALMQGLQSQAATAPERPAGQGHADTIRALAAAHKKGKGGS